MKGGISIGKKENSTFSTMSGEEMQYIQKAFTSNWIAPLGPNVDAFEKEIAHYVGTSDAIAVNSGTAAIHLALSILNEKKKSTILASTISYFLPYEPNPGQ